jgi:hypothetical protein
MNLLANPNKHVDMSDPCSVVHDMKNAHKYEMMQKNHLRLDFISTNLRHKLIRDFCFAKIYIVHLLFPYLNPHNPQVNF